MERAILPSWGGAGCGGESIRRMRGSRGKLLCFQCAGRGVEVDGVEGFAGAIASTLTAFVGAADPNVANVAWNRGGYLFTKRRCRGAPVAPKRGSEQVERTMQRAVTEAEPPSRGAA